MVNTIKTGFTCMVKVNRRYSQALVQQSATGRFPVGMDTRESGVLHTFIEFLNQEADKKDMKFHGFMFLHMSVGCVPDNKFKMALNYCDVVKILHGIDHECYTETLIAIYSPKV